MSTRELDVLRLIGRGRSNEEIAADLYLSIRTVERHVSNIYVKLGATGRTARAVAAAYAQAHSIT
jgi:DNA-binding NarL/FixJ family response regulator